MINLNEGEKYSQTTKDVIKPEAEVLQQKMMLDEIHHRRELEILEARRALPSEGHENRNEFKVYQVIRMLHKWTESDIETC